MKNILVRFCFCSVALVAESILAACPAGFEIKAEKQFKNYHANLCWKQKSSNEGDLYIVVNRKEQSLTQHFSVESENEIRSINFSERSINLKEGQLSLPINIESRVHESSHDEDITDLWLFQIDKNSIKKVFEMQIQQASWATHCENDCRDTLRSESTLSTGAIDKASGFKIINLHTTLTTIPYSQPDSHGKTQTSVTEYHFSDAGYIAN